MEGSKIAFGLLSSLLVSASLGCGSSSSVGPLHVYTTPMLEVDSRHVWTRDRGFDPFDVDTAPSDRPIRYADSTVVSQETINVVDDSAPVRGGEASSDQARGPRSLSAVAKGRVGTVAPEQGERKRGASESNGSEHEVTAASSAESAEFVWATYKANEIALGPDAASDVAMLYKSCKAKGEVRHSSQPTVGEIVFFHNTFDANGDGRNNDWYTLAGVVESVSGPKVVAQIWADDAIERVHLNLESESASQRDGTPINSRLRAASSNDAPFTQYFAHELFAGFCNVLGEKEQFVLIENWKPGTRL